MSAHRFIHVLLDTLEDLYRYEVEPAARATAECGGPVNDPYRVHARKVQRVLIYGRRMRPRWC
ncbi:MAG: hypothetical protein ACE141_06015 [Bryobacteraceae bacterium]